MKAKSVFAILLAFLTAAAHGVHVPYFTGEEADMTWEEDETESPISVQMTCSQKVKKVLCQFTFTNDMQDDYYLLYRNTPLEGLISHFLTIKHGRRVLMYQGIHKKRIPPTKDELVLLTAGNSISTPQIEINRAYKFPRNGLYTIQYTGHLVYFSTEKMLALQEEEELPHGQRYRGVLASTEVIVSNFHNLKKLRREEEEAELEQLLAELPEEDEDEVRKYYNSPAVTEQCPCCCKPNFVGGTAALRATTEKLHKELCGCNGYTKAVQSVDTRAALYTTWFGAATNGRKNTVKNIFNTCNNGLKNDRVTYQFGGPDCEAGDYAYTYYRGRKVVLCGEYDTAPDTSRTSGADTKRQTLVHEWTHTYSNTDDYRGAYGSAGAMRLARNNPDQAIDNADNLGYFFCDSFRAP